MVARPYLLSPLVSGLVVFGLDDLSVVFDDVGEPFASEDLLPQVIGLEAVGVGWIVLAVIPSLVEGQEPRRLAFELSTKLHLVVVDGEVNQAASQLDELFTGVPVALVLLDGLIHRLLGQAVLQLECSDDILWERSTLNPNAQRPQFNNGN